MNFTKNEQTGAMEANFTAKLLSVGKKELEANNENKTPYHPCDIEFTTEQGEVKRARGLMWKSNWAYLESEYVESENPQQLVHEDGPQEYLCTAVIDESRDDQSVLIKVSHLQGAGTATYEDFGFVPQKQEEEVKA